MDMKKDVEMEMEMEMLVVMEMEMVMEMVMVVFGAPKTNWAASLGATNASWGLRCASKRLLTSDFVVLGASGPPKGDQESPKKLPRSPQGVPKRLLGSALGALGGPRSSPSHDPRYIHHFQSLQEIPRSPPSHDLSTLSTFQSLQKGDNCVTLSVGPGVGPGPVGPPDTLALADLYIMILLEDNL